MSSDSRPAATWPVLLAGTLPAVAAAAVAVLYDAPLFLLLVLTAASASAVVPLVFVRHGSGVAGPAAVIGLVVVVLTLAATANGGTGPLAALRALAGSMAHLLSFAPPIPSRLDTVAPPLVVTWVASFCAATLAARGRRLLAAAPAVAVLVAALLLVGRAAPVPGWVAPVVGLGVAALLADRGLARRTRPGRNTARRSLTMVTAGAAVLLLAAGLLAAQGLPDGARVDPRSRYQPPEQQPQPIDPLTRLAGWAKGNTEPLASVEFVAGGPLAQRRTVWRWAILDRFDGARWTSSLRYRPTGHRLREPASTGRPAPGPVDAVQARLAIDASLTPWLPTPGTVHEVAGLDIAVDGSHDSIIATTTPTRQIRYGLVADSSSLDPTSPTDRAAIATLTAGRPDDVSDTVTAPTLPGTLDDIAQTFGPRAGESDGARALRLQDTLREGEFVSNAPPGHLYVRLAQFFDDRSPGYLKGTSEQFATAFAVLARTVGLPTRIVVGFQLPAGVQNPAAVTGTTMQAWPEVFLTGHGWVRFAPTPERRGTGSARTPPKLTELFPQPPAPPSATTQTPDTRSTQPRSTTDKDNPGRPVGPIGLVLLSAMTAVLLAALVTLAGVRRRLRTRRRCSSTDRQRAIGAWRELEDALLLAGIASGTGPASAVAARAAIRTRTSPGPLHELARIANTAAFAPHGAVGPADASRAWAISDAVTARLRARAPRGRRLTWWVRPGPLRTRR